MYDILIKGGQIVDGSGEPAFYGDIAVQDGKIARIAPEITEGAKRVIDASGLQVTPGFIDTHSHSDKAVYNGSDCYNYLEQGVTTQIAGQCGDSLAPYYPEMQKLFQLTDEQVELWSTKGATPSTFMEAAAEAQTGIHWVLVNGVVAVEGGVSIPGVRAGKLIKRCR